MREFSIFGKYSWETLPQAIARQSDFYVDPKTNRKYVIIDSENNDDALDSGSVYVDLATGEKVPSSKMPEILEFIDNATETLQYFMLYKNFPLEDFFWHHLREVHGKNFGNLWIHPEIKSEWMQELYEVLQNLKKMKENGEDPTEYVHEKLHFKVDEEKDFEKAEIENLIQRIDEKISYLSGILKRGYDSYFVGQFD